MSRELLASVLESWGGPFQEIAQQAKENDGNALQVLDAIHTGTGKSFRKLNYFGRSVVLEQRDRLSLTGVSKVLGSMAS